MCRAWRLTATDATFEQACYVALHSQRPPPEGCGGGARPTHGTRILSSYGHTEIVRSGPRVLYSTSVHRHQVKVGATESDTDAFIAELKTATGEMETIRQFGTNFDVRRATPPIACQ